MGQRAYIKRYFLHLPVVDKFLRFYLSQVIESDGKWLKTIEKDWKWLKASEKDWNWLRVSESIWKKAIEIAPKNEFPRFRTEGGAKQRLT